jgi:hypothetical protein
LTLAKDKIVAERAALASTAASSAPDSSSNPCSLDEAKARIVEARQVLQALDQGSAAEAKKTGPAKSGTAAQKSK